MPAEQPLKPPILEAIGARYLRTLASDQHTPEAADEVHILNEDERASLVRIERGVIIRAAIAGALSALAAAVAAYFADPILGDESTAASSEDLWTYWSIVGGAAVIATAIELTFLYWDALRSVNAMAHAAGLHMFEERGDRKSNPVLNALVRAALELPSPRTHDVLEPGRELSRLRVFVAALMYKAKITATNFLLKALVRRLLGRVIVRAYLEFVAIPATALWNALVCRWVIREARIRVMGPSAVRESIADLLGNRDASENAKRVAVRAVGSVISRNPELHPNLECLFAELLIHIDVIGASDIGDSDRFLSELSGLGTDDAAVVMRVLEIGLAIDGHATKQERELLIAAQAACGLKPDAERVRTLIRQFAAGHGLSTNGLSEDHRQQSSAGQVNGKR